MASAPPGLSFGVAELVRVLRFLKSHDFSYPPPIKNGQGTRGEQRIQKLVVSCMSFSPSDKIEQLDCVRHIGRASQTLLLAAEDAEEVAVGACGCLYCGGDRFRLRVGFGDGAITDGGDRV